MALHGSGAQLERICRGYRRSKPGDAAAAFTNRRLTVRRNDDGTTSFSITVPDDQASVANKAIERQVTAMIDDAVKAGTGYDSQALLTRRQAMAERGGLTALRADAAMTILTGQVADQGPILADVTVVANTDNHPAKPCDCGAQTAPPAPDTSAETPQGPTAPPAPDTSAETPQGPTAPPAPDTSAETPDLSTRPERFRATIDRRAIAQETVERLCCDPRIGALIEDASNRPLGLGRSTRFINRRLRRALERRDGDCCQFPGCASNVRPHAHNIVHWIDGGSTELDNLILLCHFHHHSVHERGWTIDPDSRTFIDPSNNPIDPRPATLLHPGHPSIIEPVTWHGADLEPPMYGPFDLGWTTVILHHNETLRRQESEAAMN